MSVPGTWALIGPDGKHRRSRVPGTLGGHRGRKIYGRIMNPSLAEYHVPVHMDVAGIEVMWTDIPDPHSPMGARGVGEIGIPGVGAAVANTVFNATGKRVRDLPIPLDMLM